MSKLQDLIKKSEAMKAKRAQLAKESESNAQRCEELRAEIAGALLVDADTQKAEKELYQLESKARIVGMAIARAGEEIAQLAPQVDAAQLEQGIEEYMNLEQRGRMVFAEMIKSLRILETAQEDLLSVSREMAKVSGQFREPNFQAEPPTKMARTPVLGHFFRNEILAMLKKIKDIYPDLLPEWEYPRNVHPPLFTDAPSAPPPDMSWYGNYPH